MDYLLQRSCRTADAAATIRVVPSKPRANLRKGGGRKDSIGWTEHKRKANRLRLEELRPLIKTGLTVVFPRDSTTAQLSAINDCLRNFFKKEGIAARAVWEGPAMHVHIALAIAWDPEVESRLWRRLSKRWLKLFSAPMPSNTLLWEPKENPDAIAFYYSKTRTKGGRCVKAPYSWLTFCPVWEIGYRSLQAAARLRAAGNAGARQWPALACDVYRPDSPHYTADPAGPRFIEPSAGLRSVPEKEGHRGESAGLRSVPEKEGRRGESAGLRSTPKKEGEPNSSAGPRLGGAGQIWQRCQPVRGSSLETGCHNLVIICSFPRSSLVLQIPLESEM